MKIDSAVTSLGEGAGDERASAAAFSGNLKAFVFALFFAFGGITSLNDVLIPKLKLLFTLSYRNVMLVQSAFFAAYFIVSLPAAALVRRVGYMRSAVAGLITMMGGCLLFEPASSQGSFVLFLIALFVLAAGITIVQVVANPLISMLGPPATASSRLTFAQAFNSLGTTLFPYVGSVLILGSLAISFRTTGQLSACSLLAIGMFNSIMFPTIFTLASDGLGRRAAEGSGIICMAIVGGAVMPIVTGKAADLWGLKWALIVPAACYAGIVLFGWYARRPVRGEALAIGS